MVIEVLNSSGARVSEVELSAGISEGRVNTALFYETVKMQLANRRTGTACTKTRAEVSGGGAKPWKQKGTGRARSGSNRSPVWRHGGTVFGPRPRDYSYNMPKKAVLGALRSALKLKVQEGKFKVFDSVEVAEPRTKAALEFIGKAGLNHALIVVEGTEANLKLGARNLKDYKVLDVAGLNVYDILRYDDLAITTGALEKVEARLK